MSLRKVPWEDPRLARATPEPGFSYYEVPKGVRVPSLGDKFGKGRVVMVRIGGGPKSKPLVPLYVMILVTKESRKEVPYDPA